MCEFGRHVWSKHYYKIITPCTGINNTWTLLLDLYCIIYCTVQIVFYSNKIKMWNIERKPAKWSIVHFLRLTKKNKNVFPIKTNYSIGKLIEIERKPKKNK